MRPLAIIALCAFAATGACANERNPTPPTTGLQTVRVVNGSTRAVQLRIGPLPRATVPASAVSDPIFLDAGVPLQVVDGAGSSVSLSFDGATSGGTRVAVATGAPGFAFSAKVLADTNAVVPAGKTKLRVAHAAPTAPAVDIWRTQPDFQSPTRVQFPFRAGDTSPYLQSDAGNWEVFVTAAGAPATGTRLATTGAVALTSGQRATVVLVDSAGTLRLRVVRE